MIFQLPSHFDKNEWFILISIILLIMVIYFLPKHFQFVQVLSIWLFNFSIGETVDFTVATPPIDLYDVNDSKKYELFDLILYLSLYPASIYIFLTLLKTWKVLKKHWIIYLLIVAIITTLLEWISNQTGVFHYNHWSTWYSLPVYFVIYGINMYLYLFIKRHIRLNNKREIEKV
jgi:hypothetical protein